MTDRRSFIALTRHGEAVRIHPPWSAPSNEFIAQCSRCGDCIAACPAHVLVRGDGGYPEISFSRSGCTFCGRCAVSCPTGALARNGPEAKPWRLTARIASSCLATRRIECRVCGDSCEAQALRFTLMPGSVARPTVIAERCTGCGACVANCPAYAIRLEHSTAEVATV